MNEYYDYSGHDLQIGANARRSTVRNTLHCATHPGTGGSSTRCKSYTETAAGTPTACFRTMHGRTSFDSVEIVQLYWNADYVSLYRHAWPRQFRFAIIVIGHSSSKSNQRLRHSMQVRPDGESGAPVASATAQDCFTAKANEKASAGQNFNMSGCFLELKVDLAMYVVEVLDQFLPMTCDAIAERVRKMRSL